MVDERFIVLYKLRFILGGALIIVGLILLSLVISLTTTSPKAKAANTTLDSGYTVTEKNDPNVVANFMSAVGNKSMQLTSSTEHVLNNSLHTITTSALAVPAQGAKMVAKGAYSGASVVADGVSSGASFVAHLPGKMVSLASPANIVSATIQPANKTMSAPTIDDAKSSPAEVEKALAAAQPTSPKSSPANNATAQWPIHGEITTLFGVPEWPYEAVHTGLDISDGNYAGTTPIHPFKPGRVVQVIHSSYGLGNHIVVDHGGGITSVYGHLYATSAHVGQTVNINTILGYEGTTGASTGPHLHFEIRKNGQPVNPLNYIPGRP